jgi:hypothetical protein
LIRRWRSHSIGSSFAYLHSYSHTMISNCVYFNRTNLTITMARKRKATLSVHGQKATGDKRRPRNHNAIINEAVGDATAATVTAHTSSPHSNSEGDSLPLRRRTITIGKHVWMYKDDVDRKDVRALRSHIWNEDHGFKLVRQGCDDTFYYCKRCADHGKPVSLFNITRGNSSVVSHRKTKHQIDQNGNIGKQLTGQGKKEGEGKCISFGLI